MPAPLPRVDSDEELAVLEYLRPMTQREQVVERDPDTLLERLLVFHSRREVRSEENSTAIDLWKDFQHARDLAWRHALAVQPPIVDEPQDRGIRVRLHRVEHGVYGTQPLQRLDRARDALAVVNVGGLARGADFQQLGLLLDPPGLRNGLRDGSAAGELFPGCAEHAALELVHEQPVQMLHELVRVLGVHDECQVQIVRRLRDEMDLLLLKDLEHWAELVQDRADTAADECDGGTIADHGDLAELAQVLGESLDRGAVRDVRADVDGDGDVAFRRRDQVDGQPVLAKDIERVRKEPDLMPHLHRFHRY